MMLGTIIAAFFLANDGATLIFDAYPFMMMKFRVSN